MFGTIPEIVKKRPTLIRMVRVSPVTERNLNLVEKKRNNPHLENFKIYFAQYCRTTTIHGMRYIGERDRTLVERLLWIVTVFVVCALSMLLIQKTYAKWRNSPVVVTFGSQESTISTVPFPAVTICPETKFDTEIFNFTEMVRRINVGDSLTAQETESFEASCLICSNSRDYYQASHVNRTSDVLVADRLFHMSPPLDPLNVTTIKWSGEQVRAHDVLTRTVTSEGICYTFNMIPDDVILRNGYSFVHSSKHTRPPYKWSIERGYEPGDNFDAYPRRSFTPGMEGGLLIDSFYTNKSHLDYLCGSSLQGFKIVIHPSRGYPNMRKFFRLSLDNVLSIGITPKVMMASQEMRDYSPNERQCYFPNEKYLAIYKFYTLQNCLDECLANYTRMKCGCVPFYFPASRDVQICGPASHKCVRRSKVKYLKAENKRNSAQKCGCLPACLSVDYSAEISQDAWEWKKLYEVTGIISNTPLNMTDAHLSMLAVYYKEPTYLQMERNELFGLVDLYSGVGGILGLFIGFSVTSAIEVLYYFTLRIACNILKYGTRGWSGDSRLVNASP